MRARRLPTGGLVSLVVVLAAIGVVVVAGAPAPRTRVDVQRHTTTVVRTIRTVVRVTAPSRSARAGRAEVVVVERRPSSTTSTRTRAAATRTRGGARRSAPTTSTTTTSTTTTTTPRTVVTTTVPPRPPAPSSRTGVFEGGATSETARVDAVQLVNVVVPSGIQVSLTVACGLASWSATAMTSATVHVVSGGAACTATFSIPATAPQPARWRLMTA